MMLHYFQSSGELSQENGALIARCYSGSVMGGGKNNPTMQSVRGVGPLPCGTWDIVQVVRNTHLGPIALELEPTSGTNTFGRSSFYVHCDSISHPGDASHGCIVVPPQGGKTGQQIIQGIWDSGARKIAVASGSAAT